MKIFLALMFLSTFSYADTFTCYDANEPDCVRTTSWIEATGDQVISDLVIDHTMYTTYGKIGTNEVMITFPKGSDTVSLTFKNGDAPMVLGKISDAGDLGQQTFYFHIDPAVSFSAKRVGTKKYKICSESSFGGSNRYTNIYAVVETTVKNADRNVTYTSEVFTGNVENEHWSIFKCKQ